MNEKQLQALIRKTAKKVEQTKQKPRPAFDSTLDATRAPDAAPDSEASEIFQEMKKRSF